MPAAAIFIMIGAKPHTDWLAPALSRDKDGFVGSVHRYLAAPAPFEGQATP